MNTPVAATSAPQKKEITDISSMLLPLENRNLLLPGVAVAEIVRFIPPEMERDEETPPWFLGFIYWRNQRVPLVSFEGMLGETIPSMSTRCRIAVMNNTGLNQQMDFFAILLQETPRLLRLAPEDIAVNNEKIVDQGEKLHVLVSGEDAVVPDIGFIEKSIVHFLELA